MGGRALKNTTTRRYEKEEFVNLSERLLEHLRKDFHKAVVPLYYRNKETFGDIDILVSLGFNDAEFDMRGYIETNFKPNEIFHNGTCWSFDFEEIQIDIITCNPEHFDSNFMYLSYNDLGNFIGRIAHGFGLKYGQEGLWYEHTFKNKNIGKVLVSKDYSKIFSFLGLSFERWEKGFDNLEDIFTYIAESPYFNWEMFQMDQLNKINRDRNKKRASYTSFLEWMEENVADDNHAYKFAEDKTSYFIKIDDSFPEANIVTEVRRLEYLECKKLYIQSKFNGGDVMRRYGFEGKELGDKLNNFKSYIIYKYDCNYEEYIINTDTFDIYLDFEKYLKNELEAREIN